MERKHEMPEHEDDFTHYFNATMRASQEISTLRAQLAAAQARIVELEARCAMLSDADGRLQLGSKWLSMRNGSMVVFEGAPYALTSEVLYAGTDIMLALAALE